MTTESHVQVWRDEGLKGTMFRGFIADNELEPGENVSLKQPIVGTISQQLLEDISKAIREHRERIIANVNHPA